MAGFYAVAHIHLRPLVDAGRSVGAQIFCQIICISLALIILDHDRRGIYLGHFATLFGYNHMARIDGGACLDAGTYDRRLGLY